MNTQIRDLAKKIIDYIKDEAHLEEDGWIPLNIKTVCDKWEVPTYMSRYALCQVRINANIRYRYISTASRFKPKEYKYDEPSKKISDLGKIQQFEMKDSEEKYIIKMLKDYMCPEQSETFYILGYLCEKLKIKGIDRDWGIIPVGEFAKFFDIPEANVLFYISALEKSGILIKSPITLGYKMALSEDISKEARQEVDKGMINESSKLKGDVNFDLIKCDGFTEIPEVEPLRSALESMVDYNAKLGNLIFKQLQNFDAIKLKDDQLRKQKEIFFRLNKEYVSLKQELAEKEEEYKELKRMYDALSRLEDNRTSNISLEMGALNSEIISLLKRFNQLPVHKKNEPAIMNMLEYKISNSIMEHTKKAIDFKIEED